MHFISFLKRYFGIEYIQDCGAEFLFVYEKGEFSEPLFILREYSLNPEVQRKSWIVGNVYSTLEHGKEYSEQELRKMIKEGKIPALRLRRRIVIPIDEFNEWVRIESWGAVKATI